MRMSLEKSSGWPGENLDHGEDRVSNIGTTMDAKSIHNHRHTSRVLCNVKYRRMPNPWANTKTLLPEPLT